MAEFNLNRIRFTWKGEWQISTQYTIDDIVYYEGKAYVCLVNHSSSINFYNELNNQNPRWELMFDGNQWSGDWQTDTDYSLDEIVKFKGFLFQCITPHRSTVVASLGPRGDIENWKVVAATYNWTGEWQSNFFYNVGDVITYRGTAYISIEPHRSKTISEGLEADFEKWNIVTRSDNWLLDWNTNNRYSIDDIVRYGGIVYRCVQNHQSAETVELGLESDQDKWEIVLEGIEYKGLWAGSNNAVEPVISGVRYKKNDIVKYNHSLWICQIHHTSSELLSDDQSFWEVWLPGLGYEELWQAEINYKKGDIVLYGGYAYTALENNNNSVPSINGKLQDTGDWELLKEGYRHRGEWNEDTQYRTGDVVRNNGYLYLAIADVTVEFPDSSIDWKRLVPGYQWQGAWNDNTVYYKGDIVTYASYSYYCIQRHDSVDSESRPDLDIEKSQPEFWETYVAGSSENVLVEPGDIVTNDGTADARFAIGNPGETLKVTNGSDQFLWENFEEVNQVFYVSTNGIDETDRGRTLSSPFRTIRFATEYILNNVDTNKNTTVFVKTGLFEENLPIRIPKNCAVVGDELRSTTVQPAEGFEESNMFLVRNGSGLRNMTLQGLSGTLSEPGEYNTRRPSAGAFVSLDPGEGPDDESVWITTKSCYVQNVSTFGTACIGMKIDGSLHNGGNRSIVANDFTQVLSDGIGYWADNLGRSELVSVFTYFCYIGYLSTNGGILRATNGNNSYGVFGSRAEGVNENETPITCKINNRDNEAQFKVVHTNGNQILGIGYEHAGQEYSDASVQFQGTGTNAAAQIEEFRNNAISQVRLIDPADSSTPGGINYQTLLNNAQGGNDREIFLSAADTTGTAEKYIGMRIFLEAGRGVGQYGVITDYDELTKKATISREYDLGAGWEHVYPGYPISNTLDGTTRYRVEPKVNIDEPEFTSQGASIQSRQWKYIAYGNGIWVVCSDEGEGYISRSIDNGETWSTPGVIGVNYQLSGIVYSGQKFIISLLTASGSATNIYLESIDGNSWTESTNIPGNSYVDIATDGNETVYLLGTDPNVLVVSEDNGTNWTSISIPSTPTFSVIAVNPSSNIVVLPEVGGNGDVIIVEDGSAITASGVLTSAFYTDAVYGKGRFVITAPTDNIVAISFDGITWDTRILEDSIGEAISYGSGVFLSPQNNTIYKSQDGLIWKNFGEDSSLYSIQAEGTSNWTGIAHNDNRWISVGFNNDIALIDTGANPFVRVVVESSRVDSFTVYDPGSGYVNTPNLTLFDPENTEDALYQVRLNSGVLPQPIFTNRGEGYTSATGTISGNGFADIFQTGNTIKVSSLSRRPGPGDNFVVNGIDDVIYRVVRINSISGTEPNFEAELRLSPSIGNQESPDHNEDVVIRQEYSQVRLTGHDFLDIGTGNENSTRYPELYIFGQSSDNETRPENETSEIDGGRIFYTSTDQDGNFRVGELFRVQQSTGIVSISADFFDLDGLTEISLGGIVVGGSAVVVREFSKETSFVANSNNIVPTQRAIARYLESRISSGGSDAITNTLIAGQVRVSGNTISTTSGNQINIPVKVEHTGGIDGDYFAQMYFGFGGKVD